MKKKETSSKYVFVLSNLDKVFVRKYKSKELKWYLSGLSQKDIFRTIEHSNIKHPFLLKKRLRYIDMQYIPGKILDNTFEKMALSGLICNYIYEFMKIDCTSISKKVKWSNNTGFYNNLITLLIQNIKKSKCEIKLNHLGLSVNDLENYRNETIDNQRKLSLIHGNINRKNIINNNGVFYLINWDESTYGDIAYELASHLINEDYSKDEIGSMIERISSSNGLNQSNLIHDVSLYIQLDYRRQCIKGIIECINLHKKGKDYNYILEKVFEVYSKLNDSASIEEVRQVIESK